MTNAASQRSRRPVSAMAEGRAFTIVQRGSEELVAAYEVATGREIWTSAWQALFREHYGGAGPRSTPTWHRGTLFALGATGELRALDGNRQGALADQHPRGCRRIEPRVGHGGLTARGR